MGVLHQSLEQEMDLPRELIRPRTKKRLADRARRKLRVEATVCVEPDLSGIDCTVMKPAARLQSRSIEIGRTPAKAIRIVLIGWMHHPPVRTEADYADVHSPDSMASVFKRVRVWSI